MSKEIVLRQSRARSFHVALIVNNVERVVSAKRCGTNLSLTSR